MAATNECNEQDEHNEFDSTEHWDSPRWISNESTESLKPPVEVPLDMLTPEAVNALIDAFILREGTDYGRTEIALETKQQQIRKQIEKNQVKIIFDPNTETVTLLTAQELKRIVPSSS
jgi:uncharacterized protein